MAAIVDGSRVVMLTEAELLAVAERANELGYQRGRASVQHDEPSPLLDRQGIARALDLSLATVDRRTKEGLLPFVRVGATRRYDLDECRRALAARGDSTGISPGNESNER